MQLYQEQRTEKQYRSGRYTNYVTYLPWALMICSSSRTIIKINERKKTIMNKRRIILLRKGITYGIHTGNFKHRISKKEAYEIKKQCECPFDQELTDCDRYYRYGINKLSIIETERKFPKDKEWQVIPEYWLSYEINIARVWGGCFFKTMPYKKSNVKAFIKKMTTFNGQIGLENENKDFAKWTVERIDTAFDMYEDDPCEVMIIMNVNADIRANRRKRYRRKPINGDPDIIKRQSMRYGNNSETWNIYVKAEHIKYKKSQMKAKRQNISDDMMKEAEEMQNIIRFELQNLAGAIKKRLPNRTVEDLLYEEVREGIKLDMIAELIPVFLGVDEALLKENPEKEGIIARIAEKPLVTRSHGVFPKPNFRNGRWHANIPCYRADILCEQYLRQQYTCNQVLGWDAEKKGNSWNRGKHITISFKVREQYDRAALEKLKKTCIRNYDFMKELHNTEGLYMTVHDRNHTKVFISLDKSVINQLETICIRAVRDNVDAIRRLGEYTKVEQIRDEALQIQEAAGSLRLEFFDMYGVISFLLNENE